MSPRIFVLFPVKRGKVDLNCFYSHWFSCFQFFFLPLCSKIEQLICRHEFKLTILQLISTQNCVAKNVVPKLTQQTFSYLFKNICSRLWLLQHLQTVMKQLALLTCAIYYAKHSEDFESNFKHR